MRVYPIDASEDDPVQSILEIRFVTHIATQRIRAENFEY